jgi:hypothetical protein
MSLCQVLRDDFRTTGELINAGGWSREWVEAILHSNLCRYEVVVEAWQLRLQPALQWRPPGTRRDMVSTVGPSDRSSGPRTRFRLG